MTETEMKNLFADANSMRALHGLRENLENMISAAYEQRETEIARREEMKDIIAEFIHDNSDDLFRLRHARVQQEIEDRRMRGGTGITEDNVPYGVPSEEEMEIEQQQTRMLKFYYSL